MYINKIKIYTQNIILHFLEDGSCSNFVVHVTYAQQNCAGHILICGVEEEVTYISITVRVYLAVRVTSVVGNSTPGPRTADLGWARLIGVSLLLLLGRPQGAQAGIHWIALQSVEGGWKMRRAGMTWHRSYFWLVETTVKGRILYLGSARYWFLPPLCIV